MMQKNSPYKGIINCIHKTVTEEGMISLYKGFFPIWFRLAPWQLIFWVSYEKLRILSGLKSF
jgi:solute carrier family 25 uncoupling protein 27